MDCRICHKLFPTLITLAEHQVEHCFVNIGRLKSEQIPSRPIPNPIPILGRPGGIICEFPQIPQDFSIPQNWIDEFSSRIQNPNQFSTNPISDDDIFIPRPIPISWAEEERRRTRFPPNHPLEEEPEIIGNPNPTPTGISIIGIITDNYRCSACNDTCSTNADFALHLITHLPQRGNLQCSQCGIIFFQKRALKEHLLLHFNIKEFDCGFCQLKFPNKPALLDHLPSHGNDKPHQCEVCKQNFTLKSVLDLHRSEMHKVKKKKIPHCCIVET